jgi:hypothetical protein
MLYVSCAMRQSEFQYRSIGILHPVCPHSVEAENNACRMRIRAPHMLPSAPLPHARERCLLISQANVQGPSCLPCASSPTAHGPPLLITTVINGSGYSNLQ